MDAPNIRQCEVDRIKRHDQVLGIVNLLKGSYNARLSSDRPSKVLVGNSILEAHALFSYQRELVFVDRGQVIAVIAEVAGKCECFTISRCGVCTYNPSNQLYILSAYLSALSFGIAPLMTA